MPDGKFYAIGYHGDECFKGILVPEGITVEQLQKNLLNIGLVVSVVDKEKYDNFDPKAVKFLDLGVKPERKEI